MSTWLAILVMLLARFISATPAPEPIRFAVDGLEMTLAPALAEVADEEGALPFIVPGADDLIRVKTRALFGAGYREDNIDREGWRWWGVVETDEDNWGGYDERAWVIAAQPGFRRSLDDLESWIRQADERLPQVPRLRQRVCYTFSDHPLLYESLAVQPLDFENGTGFSALYVCMTAGEGYGDGPECGGYFADFISQMWYAFHGLTDEGTLVLFHVPLNVELPQKSLMVSTCHDPETDRTSSTYFPRDWEAQGWVAKPNMYPELSPEARDELYAQVRNIATALSTDPDSGVVRARAALDETVRSLYLRIDEE